MYDSVAAIASVAQIKQQGEALSEPTSWRDSAAGKSSQNSTTCVIPTLANHCKSAFEWAAGVLHRDLKPTNILVLPCRLPRQETRSATVPG
jgi:serine/threonine protein kinase